MEYYKVINIIGDGKDFSTITVMTEEKVRDYFLITPGGQHLRRAGSYIKSDLFEDVYISFMQIQTDDPNETLDPLLLKLRKLKINTLNYWSQLDRSKLQKYKKQ